MRRYDGETVRINGYYNAVNFAIIVFAIAGDIARWDFTIALFYAQKNAVRQSYRTAFLFQTNNLNPYSNKCVLKYLNPVSARRATMFLPLNSGRCANCVAA